MRLSPTAHPTQVAELQRYVESHGIPFKASDRFEWRQIYNHVTIPVAALTETLVFDSSAGDHTLKLAGCNLPKKRQLDDNESFIATEIWWEPVDVTTANGVLAATKFASFGYLKEFNVGNDRALRDMKVSRMGKRAGVQILTAGEGLVAATISGVSALDDGRQLALPDRIVIPAGSSFYGSLSFNHGGALAATLDGYFSLFGLSIVHG